MINLPAKGEDTVRLNATGMEHVATGLGTKRSLTGPVPAILSRPLGGLNTKTKP